ncbi:MAG: hypothetical protein E4H37_05935 [Gemmatimonadales bacterium]|nr:MAG: hypothetical protein E4H37_05935 [Gemmatimonadales bacterium]
MIIWNSPLTVGDYDAVVDFGSTAATTAGTYMTDGQYNPLLDFLDGADQIGFRVARDPYELGTFAIGADSYSQDDFFATLGSRTNVDLRAVIRYPATTGGTGTPVAPGAHPLFLIEHGNHGFCRVGGHTHATCPDRVRNHEGYMRLLEILASHGIIAVSIDAYDLTGPVPQLIPERGQLILKHIELWSHMSNATTFTTYPDFFSGRFAGHVDLSKISVSGHSRGGEASVAAYMLNTEPSFLIRAVSSIAPVDGQAYVLPDVPYFVILPAGDGDVSSLAGARIYDRAGSGLTTPDLTTKSAIDVYGASHNFFNTVWAADGDDSPATRPDYIPAADQQRLGEAYLAAFTRVHLTGETVYEDMLRGRLVFPSTAGRKIYAVRHEKIHSRLMSGNPAGWTPAGGASATTVSNPSPQQTQVALVAWSSSTGELTRTVPAAQRDASTYEVLALRAAQTWSAANPATGSQDFQIELTGGGKTKGIYIARFYPLPKPYAHPYGLAHTLLTTVRIPLHSYIMNNAGVTLDDIDTIRFRFFSPSTGELYVDDIEFSR